MISFYRRKANEIILSATLCNTVPLAGEQPHQHSRVYLQKRCIYIYKKAKKALNVIKIRRQRRHDMQLRYEGKEGIKDKDP